MRTLSIRQPWAWLIVNGHMNTINSDVTAYRGPLLIRAGLALTKRLHSQVAEHAVARWRVNIPAFDDLPRGGIVGAAVLASVGEPSPDHWSAPEADWPAGLVLTPAIALPLFLCVPEWREGTQWYDVPMHQLPASSQRLVLELGRGERVEG